MTILAIPVRHQAEAATQEKGNLFKVRILVTRRKRIEIEQTLLKAVIGLSLGTGTRRMLLPREPNRQKLSHQLMLQVRTAFIAVKR